MSLKLKIALVLVCLWSTASCARDDYGDSPAAMRFIDQMAEEEGFNREELQQVFAHAERQESILAAIARPAEKTKAWYEYREIFLNDKRLSQGIEFYQQQRDTLQRAEQEFGVPAQIIVAVIGVETYYGRVAGSYRVIDALSTLAFDYPKRSEFFTKELKNYLLLTREQGMDPLQMKGSYAGAMGYGQFMPSSYRNYAVDYDGDEIIDIWENPVDAIGSVANYFREHGWRQGQAVVAAAQVSGEAEIPEDMLVHGRQLLPEYTVADFEAVGLVPLEPLAPEADATAMKFELQDGYEYWLGLHNFYVITRYNHSAMYAMSVYQLSEQIAAGIAR